MNKKLPKNVGKLEVVKDVFKRVNREFSKTVQNYAT